MRFVVWKSKSQVWRVIVRSDSGSDGPRRSAPARVTVWCLVQPAPDVVCVCHAGIQIVASLDAEPVVVGYTYTVTDNAGNTAVINPRARITTPHHKAPTAR